MKTWMLILFLLLLGTTVWALERRARSEAEERAAVAEAAVDSLDQLAEQLRKQYRVDTVTLTRWKTRWDSIVGPGRTDTLTIERVILVADSTIRACEAVVKTCERRVAVERERGDSAVSAATQWKRVARGSFIRPAFEATLETEGWTPQLAAEVTLGRGHLKVLGRLEGAQGPEVCDFVPQTEAYACSRDWATTARLGLRWGF